MTSSLHAAFLCSGTRSSYRLDELDGKSNLTDAGTRASETEITPIHQVRAVENGIATEARVRSVSANTAMVKAVRSDLVTKTRSFSDIKRAPEAVASQIATMVIQRI